MLAGIPIAILGVRSKGWVWRAVVAIRRRMCGYSLLLSTTRLHRYAFHIAFTTRGRLFPSKPFPYSGNVDFVVWHARKVFAGSTLVFRLVRRDRSRQAASAKLQLQNCLPLARCTIVRPTLVKTRGVVKISARRGVASLNGWRTRAREAASICRDRASVLTLLCSAFQNLRCLPFPPSFVAS